MTPVDAVGFLPPTQLLPDLGATGAQGFTSGTSFAQWMANEAKVANERINQADRLVQRLASGDTSNLHEVMLGIERARMQFQLLVQVRNRVLEAYQDVLRMQV